MTVRARPWLPYALVLGAGLALGALQFALDDRDPLVFTIPILGLTAITLLVMRLSGGGDRASMERLAAEEGLRYDGVGPLPTVTPILRDVREPAHILSARLPDRGPRVRLAQVRGGRRVAISEAPPRDVHEEQDWLAQHPLRPEAESEDGLLVVAVPARTSYQELLGLTAELHARLAG
jgi:hypothetical protein